MSPTPAPPSRPSAQTWARVRRPRFLEALLLFTAALAVPALHATTQRPHLVAKPAVHRPHPAPARVAATKHVRVVPVAASPSSIAELRTVSVPRGFQAVADNHLAGPVEVRLEFARNDNVRADPMLPSRTVVPAQSSTVLALIEAVDTARVGGFEVRMDVIPGDPEARAADVEYLLPLHLPQFRIEQGFGGTFSHNDEQNRYALDFAAPIGTPVYAAREGVVMEVESDFARAGLNLERYGGRANLIRILHDDGTMGVYAHLDTDGVIVRVGQRVRAGQQIGLSGNTGFTTGPHLHFAVQINRGMRLESIRFRMRGPQGPMRLSGN